VKSEEPAYSGAAGATVRVSVDLRDLDDRPLDVLRMLLLADVLRRVEEEHSRRVLLVVLEDTVDAGVAAAATELGIRHLSLRTSSPAEAESFLGGTPEVMLRSARSEQPLPSPPRHTLRIGTVTAPHGNAAKWGPALLPRDRDPLALRLALLRAPYASSAELSLARLHRAEETLERWRIKIAGWRDTPPASPPQDTMAATRAALANLDTGTVLRLLHRLEIDLHVPSGAKFEAFTRTDRVLGLDLRRLVGKRPR
jgi:hypothetical protein